MQDFFLNLDHKGLRFSAIPSIFQRPKNGGVGFQRSALETKPKSKFNMQKPKPKCCQLSLASRNSHHLFVTAVRGGVVSPDPFL